MRQQAANQDDEQPIFAHPDAEHDELALQRFGNLDELLRGAHHVVDRRNRHEHEADGEQHLVEMAPAIDMNVERALEQSRRSAAVTRNASGSPSANGTPRRLTRITVQ